MVTDPRPISRPVEQLFLNRWSPRAFDESGVSPEDLDTILDAARWAPSAFNYQPWRFVYAHREGPDWERFLALLLPFNAAWAKRAGVLLFVLSDTLIDTGSSAPAPSHSHSFDTGAAWSILALQALQLGYHTHGMLGFNQEKARTELRVPERFRIEAAIALGRQAGKHVLPESLQAREEPSGRKELAEYAWPGNFR